MFGRSKNAPAASTTAPDVLSDLSRGTDRGPGLALKQRFQTPAQIAADPTLQLEPGNPYGKLFVGLAGAQVHAEFRDGRINRWATGGTLIGIDDDRHIATFAGTRAGKGRGLVIPNLLLYPGSVVVLDPKGDLANETADYRARVLGQRVFVLDPGRMCAPSVQPYQAAWNPLKLRGDESQEQLIDIASLVAESLVVRNSRDDSHWDDTASAFIFAVVLHVLTSPSYGTHRSIDTVHELLMTKVNDGTDEEPCTLEREMLHNEAAEGAVAFGAAAFFDKGERERDSVLSTARRHVHFLSHSDVARLVSQQSDIDLSQIQGEPTTIYLSIPATKLGVWAGLSRMFVNLCLGAFESGSLRHEFQHRTGRLPVLMILDEFASMGTMTRLADAAGQVAGLGCKLWPILQDMGQLRSLYKDRWETFIANMGVTVFFGNQDLTTLEWIQKRLGDTTITNFSQSQQAVDAAVRGGASGASFSMATHPLLTIPEIARIFNRDDPMLRQLVVSGAHGPLILQRAFYDKHEALLSLRTHGRRHT